MIVPKSFTAVGVGPDFLIEDGKSFTYDVSGVFVGTVIVEKAADSEWRPIAVSATASKNGTVIADAGSAKRARYRFRCMAFTSGTIVTALADVTPDVLLAWPQGVDAVFERVFVETAGAGVYTASVVVPAGATIEDIIINGVALWNPATSALLTVGDGANASGYYAAVDLKATDLLAGESLSFALAGGKAGVYIANSQVSPRYSASQRTISAVVTTVGGSGSTGRTRMSVICHLPTPADIVTATKV